MPYATYKLVPGVNREGTAFSAQGGWFDSNLVRFRKNFPEKIGGWEKEQTDTYLGTGRALHAWVSLGGTKYLSLGTTLKYYVKDGTNFYDITPIRDTNTGTATFTSESGSSTITVTDSSHGAAQNDFVTFTDTATLGTSNITNTVLNQEYQIASITNANVYTIVAKDTSGNEVTANATVSGGGGTSTVAKYQISVGLDDYVSGSGWGASTWGDSTFGSASTLAFNNQLRIWTHDTFGEDLVINPRAGGIFYWTEDNGTSARAQSLTELGATLPPTLALQVLVSDVDRHVICLGADPLNDAGTARTGAIDPMFIAWSDQENINDWKPTLTNTAGSLRLSAGTQIIGALRSRQEILIWTDDALYSMQFIGPPYTFGVNLINSGVGMVAPKAAVNTPAGVYWMDRSGFYNYNGSVSRVPCSVHNYVFNDFNQSQSFKVFGYLNRQFNEVGWFYPSGSSSEIDRYVVFNYQENVWYYGQMTRFAWLDEGVQPYPRATGTDTYNYVYRHETGNDADGTPMDNVYIESADFSLDGIGNAYTQVQNAIPDVRFLGSGGSGQVVNFVLKTRNYPNESLTTKSTSQVTESTEKVDLRGRARQAVVRLESDDDASTEARLGVGWRLGDMRLNTRPDGRR
tara:strand:+ start:1190 stop:3076 length:1887 start_codon:yes stop_codon:yes gene_type:complete